MILEFLKNNETRSYAALLETVYASPLYGSFFIKNTPQKILLWRQPRGHGEARAQYKTGIYLLRHILVVPHFFTGIAVIIYKGRRYYSGLPQQYFYCFAVIFCLLVIMGCKYLRHAGKYSGVN
jgi:hypothetical protein